MKRSMLYGLIAAVVSVLALLAFVIYAQVIQPVIALRSSIVLQGPSMEPTFKEGARLRTKPADPAALKRGDVVLFTDPAKLDRTLVKRIVALAGDRVELRGGILYLNGSQVAEPYTLQTFVANVAPIEVPPGKVYVLGDNRGASFDSRHFGPLPIENVTAIIIEGN
jgi:signal peptidase I